MKTWTIQTTIEHTHCQYRKEIVVNDEDVGFCCEYLKEFPPCCEETCPVKTSDTSQQCDHPCDAYIRGDYCDCKCYDWEEQGDDNLG